jgi:hypothetical protein
VNQCKAFVRFVSPATSPKERFEAFFLLPSLIAVNSEDLDAFVPNVGEILPGTSAAATQFARRFGSPSILATILSSVNYSPVENYARITAIKCTPAEGERYFEPAALNQDELHSLIEYFVTDKSKLLLEDSVDFRGRRAATLGTFVAAESTMLERIQALMSESDILKLTDKKKPSPNLWMVMREAILSCLQSSISQRTRDSATHILQLEKETGKDLQGELINAAFAAVVFPKSLGAATEEAQMAGFFGYADIDSLLSFANTVIDMAPEELKGRYPDGYAYGTGAHLPRIGIRKGTTRSAFAASPQSSSLLSLKLRKRKSVDTDSSSTGLSGAPETAKTETQPAAAESSATATTALEAPPSPKRPKLTETTEEDAVDGIAALSDFAASSMGGSPKHVDEEMIDADAEAKAKAKADAEAKDSMDVDLSAADALVGVRSGGNPSQEEDVGDADGTVDEEEEVEPTDESGPGKRARGRPRRQSLPVRRKSKSPQDDRPRRANAGVKKLDTSYILPNTFRRAAAHKAMESMSAFVSQDERFEHSLVTRMTKADKKSLLAEEEEQRKPSESWAPSKSTVLVLPNKRYRSKAEARQAYMKAYREQRQRPTKGPASRYQDDDDDEEEEEMEDYQPEPAESGKSPTRQSQRLATAASAPTTPAQAKRQKLSPSPSIEAKQKQPAEKDQTQPQNYAPARTKSQAQSPSAPTPAPAQAPAPTGAPQVQAPAPPTHVQAQPQQQSPVQNTPQNFNRVSQKQDAPPRTSDTPAVKAADPDGDAVKALVLFFQTTCSASQIPYDVALLHKSARSLVAEGVTKEGLLLSVIDAQTASGLAAFLNQKKVVDVVVRALVIQRFGDAGKMHFSVKIESTSVDVITQCVTEFETFFKKSILSNSWSWIALICKSSRILALIADCCSFSKRKFGSSRMLLLLP